jgi:hypothetical protein
LANGSGQCRRLCAATDGGSPNAAGDARQSPDGLRPLPPNQTASSLCRPTHQLPAHRPAGYGSATADQRPQGGTSCDSGEYRQRFVCLLVFIPVGQILEDVHFVRTLRGPLLQYR